MSPQENLQKLLGCKITTHDEKIECNHEHFDVLKAGSKRIKKEFPKVIACFSHPLKEDGSIDYDKDWEDGHVWTKEELHESRKQEIKKQVPLLLKERRGRRLLRKHLSKTQWDYYLKHGKFAVVNKNRVFIINGYNGVQELNSKGELLMSYCLHGKATDLPQSDVLLLQKLLIETNLEKFLEVANATEQRTTIDSIIMENNEIDYSKLEWLHMTYEGSLRLELPMEWERAFEEVEITDPLIKKRILESIANNKYVVYNFKEDDVFFIEEAA